MIDIEHDGRAPQVHPSARIAPTATLVGDVRIGPRTSVGFGAVLVAESGPVVLGEDCIVMEGAVLRGLRRDPLHVGDRVLIGPQASLAGCTVHDEAFIATGAAVFNGAVIGHGAEVRVHAVVHLRTELDAFATVPIGWVAAGAPAQLFPPEQHEQLWAVQRTLDFPGRVFGAPRPEEGSALLATVAPAYAAALGRRHRRDRPLVGDGGGAPSATAGGPPDGLPTYRLLTGPDDAAFCHRVSEALALGYTLHGGPAITFDGERAVVAQAVRWPGT